MALLTRFSHLLRADAHGILDQLETPDLIVRQSIREMETAIGAHKESYQGTCQQLDQTRRSVSKQSDQLAAVARELDVCFAGPVSTHQQSLTRAIIRKRLLLEQTHALTIERQENLLSAVERQQRQLQELETELDLVQQQYELFAPQLAATKETEVDPSRTVTETDIDVALRAELQRRGLASPADQLDQNQHNA